MKKFLLTGLILFSVIQISFAQNVGVNTTGAAPAITNMFEVLQPSVTTNSVGIYVSHTVGAAGITSYGLQALNSSAGLNNIAAYFSATGATNNYGLIVPGGGGRVGIGTISPSSLLNVVGVHATTQFRLTLPAADNGGGTGDVNLQLWASEPGITWDAGGIGTNVTNDNGAPAGFGRINTGLGQSYIRFITNGGAMAFNTTNNAGTYFQTMYMTGGNVGIGTTAPIQKLDVSGNIRLGDNMMVEGDGNFRIYRNLATYSNNVSAAAGAFVINTSIPWNSAYMFTTTLKGYFYDATAPFEVTLGAYMYVDNNFYNKGFTNIGANKPTVRLARNAGSNTVAIIIGSEASTYSYPKMSVSEFKQGYTTPVEAHADGWTMTQLTSLAGYDFIQTVPDVTTIPAGSGNYIQNQYASAQSANFWVSGEGRVGNWFRNSSSGTGLYNETTGAGIYSPSGGLMSTYNSSNFRIEGTTLIGNQGSSTTYGALTIQGAKNGWSGINFKDASGNNQKTLMITSSYSGIYNSSDNNWDWYWNGGALEGMNGYTPTNKVMRMTPNLHLNSVGGNAVILNWDNGTTGTALTFRIGNGASADVFDVLANGNTGIGENNPAEKLEVVGKTTLSRDNIGECCSGGNYTLALSENSAGTGRKASIQFHNSGQDEGQLQLTSGGIGVGGNTRRIKMFDNQGVNMGLELTGKLYYGSDGTRTETLNDAGANGGTGGAQSGFYETSAPAPAANWYPGASSWQHLIECRHSNNANNYALQIAGSFWGDELYFRKTQDNPARPWVKFATTGNTWGSNIQVATGSTDVSTISSTYSDIPDMTITFTPIHSTVYITFSGSGNYTGTYRSAQYAHFQLVKDGVAQKGASCHVGEWDDWWGGHNTWNVDFTYPISVTPGVSTTIKVQWAFFRTVADQTLWIRPSVEPVVHHRTLSILD